MSKLLTPLVVLCVILLVVVMAVLKQDPDPMKERYAQSGQKSLQLNGSGQGAAAPAGAGDAAQAARDERKQLAQAEIDRELDVRDPRNAANNRQQILQNLDPAYEKPAYWGDVAKKAQQNGKKRGDEVVMVDPGQTGEDQLTDEQRHVQDLTFREKQHEAIRKVLDGDAAAGGTEANKIAAKAAGEQSASARADRDNGANAAKEREREREKQITKKRDEEARQAKAREAREAKEAKEAKQKARRAKQEREDDLPTLREALRMARSERIPQPDPERERRGRYVPPPDDRHDWRVQAGAYGDPGRAENVGAVLRGLGVRYEITRVGSGSGTLYRVRTTGGMTRDNARRLSADLEKRGVPSKVFR